MMPYVEGEIAARPAPPRGAAPGGRGAQHRARGGGRAGLRPPARAWSTATSSPRTSCCTRTARWWPTSAIARALDAAGAEPADRDRADPRHAGLHEPRAGRRRARGRRPQRPLRLGCVLYEMLAGEPPFARRYAAAPAHRRVHRAGAEPRAGRTCRRRSTRRCGRALARTGGPVRSAARASLGAASVDPGHDGGRAAGGAAAEPAAAMAVLPFVNVSADPENEYFSDGMTEELITALAKVEGLRVASRTSAFAFKGNDVDVARDRARLDVGAVLEGSVRRAGRLRVTAQLVNATTATSSGRSGTTASWPTCSRSRTRWRGPSSPRCGRAARTSATRRRCGTPRTSRRTTCTSRDATLEPARRDRGHQGALRGARDRSRTRTTRSPTPGSPTAYALHVDYRTGRAGGRRPSRVANALRAARPRDRRRALAEAHASLAWAAMFIYDWDWEAAEREFLAARSSSTRATGPRTSGTGIFNRSSAGWTARWPASSAAWRSILWARSGTPPWGGGTTSPGSTSPRSTSAGARSRSTRSCRSRTTGSPMVSEELGDWDQAEAAMQRAAALSGRDGGSLASLATMAARRGREPEARALLAELEQLRRTSYVSAYDFATTHAALGEIAHRARVAGAAPTSERTGQRMAFLRVDPRIGPAARAAALRGAAGADGLSRDRRRTRIGVGAAAGGDGRAPAAGVQHRAGRRAGPWC